MADKPTTTGKDYGHRIYMNTTSYPEAIGRPSDKQYDNRVKRPHSDDKKPYYEDEYPEMEYFWTPYDPPHLLPPGMPDDPRIPPNRPDNPSTGKDPDQDEPHEFYGCVFGIPVGPKFIAPGEITFAGIGTEINDPLVSIKVEFGPIRVLTDYRDVNICMNSMFPNCLVNIQALEGFDAEAYNEDSGYYPSQIVATTLSGEKCYHAVWVAKCPPDVEFEWDYENSAETIEADDSVYVFVTGGIGPYRWAVIGEDFSLAKYETSERVNRLDAGPSSCGSAIITVVDACDTVVTASIRNTTSGSWTLYDNVCGLPASSVEWSGTCVGGVLNYIYYLSSDYILGGQRQYHKHDWVVNAEKVGTYETSAECEIARFADCGAAYESPCAPFPSSVVLSGSGCGYQGTYDYCEGTRRYPRACQANSYGQWGYISAYLREYNWEISYWEWDCP